MLSVHLIGFLAIIWVFLYYNLPSVVWFVTALLTVSLMYYSEQYSMFTCLVVGTIFLVSYALLCVKLLRKNLITKYCMGFFKKQLPQISITESQAIEAGDVWWEGDIFAGHPQWDKIEDYKLTELTVTEQNFLDKEVEELCDLLNDWEITYKHHELPPEVWDYLKQHKFFALNIAKQYGGLGFSATAQSAVVTRVASKSITAAVTIMVPNALGPGELLQHYGTDAQKNHYLPRLANAQEIPCFALTSVYGGSDAGGMLDSGIICKQQINGKETLGIKLSFSKRYITLAPVSTVIGVAFKLYDPDLLYSQFTDLGITVALIPSNHPGIKIGKRHFAMVTPFHNGPISAQDIFIPLDFIVGGQDNIGKGWYMLMECLSSGRGISLPALSTATTQATYLSSHAYVSLRKQFKVPISALEGIQEQLTKLTGLNYIANAVRLVTTSAIDHGLKPAVVSGIAKYHMTEISRICINSAMDIHAGKGVMNGPNNYLAGFYIANPIAITVEGANILTRNLIIFGQGAFRAHPFVLQEIEALNNPNSKLALGKFDTILFKHIRFVLSNVVRLLTYGLQRLYIPLLRKNNWLKGYKKDVTRMATALAVTTDMALLVIGGKLKIKEKMSARLGDMVSYLYLSICIIKYHHYLLTKFNTKIKVDPAARQDIEDCINILNAHTKWSLNHTLYLIQEALLDFLQNFSTGFMTKLLSGFLKFLIFPWGRSYQKSHDKLEQELALAGLNPNMFYQTMTELCYKNDNLLGRLNKTFHNQDKLKHILNKLDNLAKSKQIKHSNDLKIVLTDAFNKGFVTQAEYNLLHDLAVDIDNILNVDAFEDFKNDFFNDSTNQTLNLEKDFTHTVDG